MYLKEKKLYCRMAVVYLFAIISLEILKVLYKYMQ